MGKTVIFRESDYQNNVNRINESVEKFSTLLQENNRMGLVKIQNLEELRKLINGGEAFVRTKISEQLPDQSLVFGGFRLKRKSAVDMLELPDFKELHELATDCQKLISLLQYCQVKNDKVIVDPVKLEELRTAYTTSTRSTKEERLLSCYEAWVKASNEFSKASQDANGAPLFHDNPIGKFLNVMHDGSVTRSEEFLMETWGDLERKAEQARQTA